MKPKLFNQTKKKKERELVLNQHLNQIQFSNQNTFLKSESDLKLNLDLFSASVIDLKVILKINF